MKLLKVDSLAQAREKLLSHITWKLCQTEEMKVADSAGRILACEVRAKSPLPAFRRSSVDGYAVVAADTQGASESLPVFLDIAGEVEIGTPSPCTVRSGTCAYVPTGGMIPDGADAMVMVEYSELFDASSVAIYGAVPPGRNVVQIGEDVQEGDVILPAGTRIRASQIGALSGNGITSVTVWKPLRVTILSTGDELIEPGKPLDFGKIYDINTPALEQAARELGFQVLRTEVIKDEEALLEQALRDSMADSDLVVVSGGSSQGKKDITAALFDRLADPGVFTHGLALKPGKPTILAADTQTQTVLLGLPGHPAAALLVFHLLAGWLEHQRTKEPMAHRVPALMACNVPAAPGKDTYIMVHLESGEDGRYIAHPVLGKSGLMRTLTGADGYVQIPLGKEGLKTGEPVLVEFF
ncbi:MAG TPA: molybdopterin molybdotransferase MoeA [Candidatus Blautia intestinigallinarum]|nr:molybdopterin molybdotransferase MoeA [Candidatus Blautia intestinigallinarum]